MSFKKTKEEWMELTRGLPAARVAVIINKMYSIDYRSFRNEPGLNKGEMAELWIRGEDRMTGSKIDRKALADVLRKEPRKERPRSKAAMAIKQRAAEVKRFASYLPGMLPEEMPPLLKKMPDHVVEALKEQQDRRVQVAIREHRLAQKRIDEALEVQALLEQELTCRALSTK